MKTKSYLFTFLTLISVLFFSLNTFSQEDTKTCRVLLHSISGTYEGGCMNGFADGNGIAQGIDKYEGKFKNGLPDGVGKYTWANGNIYEGEWEAGKRHGVGTLYSASNGESINGYWENDEFVKEIEESKYKILNTHNITSISILKKDEKGNTVTIKFMQDGRIINEIKDLIINVTNGFLYTSNVFTYRTVTFPWNCNIRFTAFRKLSTDTYPCSINFEIQDKGTWEVIIKY